MNDIQLPESVTALLREADDVLSAHQQTKLADIAKTLEAKRTKFVDGRQISGIEAIWTKCENNYACIDEVTGENAAVMRAKYTKGMTKDAPLMRGDKVEESVSSTAFERLTARYVSAGAAKLCEIILAPGEKTFSIAETPVPDLIKAKEDLQQITVNGVGLERDPKPEEMAPPNPADPLAPAPANPAQPPSAMPGVPLTPKDLAEEAEQEAHAKAKKAEDQIFDWLIEAKYSRHTRKMIRHASRLGTGVLKGPFPEVRKAKAVTKMQDPRSGKPSMALQYKETVKPGFKAPSPWDCFPDPDCGEDIQAGSGFFERDYLSERQLRDLQTTPGYFKSVIDEAIKEGPIKSDKDNQDPHKDPKLRETAFTVWYYYGTITKEEAETLNEAMELPKGSTHHLPLEEGLPIQATLVNGRVICCVTNPCEKSGHIPYRFLRWEDRDGSPWGIGVAEQCFMPQDLINAATREMINNAAVSAGAQIVMAKKLVVAADGKSFIYGNKLWYLTGEAGLDDIKKVFGVFTIPNCTDQMLKIIMHAYQVAENSTNIPLISQGHSGKTTPDTFGAAQLQDNNANQLLRDVAANVDEYVTEPVIDDLYEWLMLDPDITDDAKGDFQIKAKGSIALVDRAIQDQYILQEYPLVNDPKFGINPKKWYAQARRAKRLDPTDVQYTEAEQQKLAQVPPPVPPQVQVAQIRAEVDAKRLQMEHERALMEYAVKQNISLQEAKTELIATTMKLRVQRELSAQDAAMDLHKHRNPPTEALTPPTEPAGRAENGEAFQA